MRRFSILFNESANNYAIIVQVIDYPDDERDVWEMYQDEIMKREIAEHICDSLNAQEQDLRG